MRFWRGDPGKRAVERGSLSGNFPGMLLPGRAGRDLITEWISPIDSSHCRERFQR